MDHVHLHSYTSLAFKYFFLLIFTITESITIEFIIFWSPNIVNIYNHWPPISTFLSTENCLNININLPILLFSIEINFYFY